MKKPDRKIRCLAARIFVAGCVFGLSVDLAYAQDSWATMSDPEKTSQKNSSKSAQSSSSNDFSGGNNTGSNGGGNAATGNEFGVEDENIFGDDPLNSATPSNSAEEVGAGVSNSAGNNLEGNANAGGNAGSPAQQNAGNFNFNNNENLNKQTTNGNQTSPVQSNSATAPVNNGLNAAPTTSNAASVPPANNAAVLTDSPVDQSAPLVPVSTEPTIAAPTIPQANNFSGAPPIPGTRRIMADGEAPIEYSVESGDTLYDVCDQLLDEGGYWPKLWSLNPEIKNPHFIYPGMKLRFYPGDQETVPFLEVVSEDDVIPLDKGPLVEKELIAEEVPMLSDQSRTEREPPPELIRAEDLQVSQETLDMFMMVGGRYADGGMRLTVPGFIFQEEKSPEGYVLGGREGRVAVSEGYKVLIEKTGSISSGTTYTVLRPGGKIERRDGEAVGFRYSFVAHVKINQIEGDVAEGTISDSRLGVKEDDIIVSYLATSRTINSLAKGAASPVPGEVVGFDERGQSLGREGGFVFVTGSNVSTGQFIPIYRGPGYAFKSSEAGGPKELEPIGQIRIIDGGAGVALGIITESLTGIKIGDTLQR